MSILEVNNVSKSFGGVKANVDISMKVEKGKIVGLIGPNGSGKTTLFNSIVGTDQLENERPTGFLSQASTMRLLSLVFGASYKGGKKLILNISNFINNHKQQGKTHLNGISITTERPQIGRAHV